MPEYVRIYDNKQGFDYVSYNNSARSLYKLKVTSATKLFFVIK